MMELCCEVVTESTKSIIEVNLCSVFFGVLPFSWRNKFVVFGRAAAAAFIHHDKATTEN